MTENGQHLSSELDLYLDGMLSPQERMAFEERLESDPALRAQLAAQESIDTSLRGLFAPPAAPALPEARPPQEQAETQPIPLMQRLRRSPWIAIAAMVLIAFSSWRAWQYIGDHTALPPYPGRPWRAMETEYNVQVAHHLKPDWLCENEQQFASAFYNKFGQALLYDPLPADAQIAGLSYANVQSQKTMLILTRVDGQPVIVFVDTVVTPDALTLTPGSPLHLHSRQVGPFTLYEVSRFSEPRLLSLFHLHEMSAEWKREAPRFKFEEKAE